MTAGPDVSAPAFAADLARLLATLAPSGEPATADLPAFSSSCTPSADIDPATPGDALAALSLQLGLVADPPRSLPASAQGIGDRVSALASAAPPVAAPAWLVRAAEALVDAPAPVPVAESASPVETMAAAQPVPVPVAASPLPAERSSSPALPPPIDVRLPLAPRQIAETVVWHVAANGGGEVRIHLNPRDLGPLDVHLKLDGDKVAVRFEAPDAVVRDVVQTSLPSLATLLSARGLQLDQAQVFSQGRGHPPTPQGQPGGGKHDDAEAEIAVETPRIGARRGLVDDYV